MEPASLSPDTSPQMSPGFHPEQLPPPTPEAPAPRSIERPVIGPETKGLEQQTQSSGSGDPAWQAAQLAASAVNPTALTVLPVADPSPLSDAPLTANDDDLIEQEWIQKAKKIVASTRTDPYLQEQEVSKLQADYLQKRYGKTIKIPSE